MNAPLFLTCNCGSYNTKLAAFDSDTMKLVTHTKIHRNQAELEQWFCSVGTLGIVAIAHRVVYGGQEFTSPIVITDEVMEKLQSQIQLASLHQIEALKMIEDARKLYPNAPQIACFDTAFHQTMPEMQRRFAMPSTSEADVICCGFHGLSYQHLAQVLHDYPQKIAEGCVIVAHLGGSSSACAMKKLQSVACTIGVFTISDDMQGLLESNSLVAHEEVELYCMMTAKEIATMLPALGGLDAIVFTGAIGENSAFIRKKIISFLNWIGDFVVFVIKTDEESVMANACKNTINEMPEKALLRWENEGGKAKI
jgi:acetate kinase